MSTVDRRTFCGTAAAAVAVSQLGVPGMAKAQGFAPLKRVRAGLLDVSYAELGPASGPPVILLHGSPYDIHAFAEVAPLLAAKGHRVIVPELRGYGATRFRSAETMRNGQPGALATDTV